MDKTGTLTEGVFKVQEIALGPEWNKEEILQLVNALESHSTHPVPELSNLAVKQEFENVKGLDSVRFPKVRELLENCPVIAISPLLFIFKPTILSLNPPAAC